jgi:hypothetical protein
VRAVAVDTDGRRLVPACQLLTVHAGRVFPQRTGVAAAARCRDIRAVDPRRGVVPPLDLVRAGSSSSSRRREARFG